LKDLEKPSSIATTTPNMRSQRVHPRNAETDAAVCFDHEVAVSLLQVDAGYFAAEKS
jgi:hypothetical protein